MRNFFSVFALLVSTSSFAQTADDLRNYFQSPNSTPYLLRSIYKYRNYEPVFGKLGQWQITATDLAAISTAIKSHGLSLGDYKLQKAAELIGKGNAFDLKTELFLGEALFSSLVHVVTGRVDPRKISDDIKYSPKEFIQWPIFASLNSQQLASLYDQLAPKNKIYHGLKQILARLKVLESKRLWKTINKPVINISIGQSNPIISHIKSKLIDLGYTISNQSSLYDPELDSVLKAIQVDLSLPFEKGLTKTSNVWRVLNMDLSNRIREVELQMEKVRWLPDELESRHAIINLANQTFYLHDSELYPDAPVLASKVIAGQLNRKTPSMSDKVVSVIFNPTWTVPLNIFFNDKLMLIKKDKNYLSRNGYKVINIRTDQEMDPSKINWSAVTRSNIDFQLVQNPSFINALGVVKFAMTNKYSIYLNDTSDRRLFENNYRLASTGGIRLERPLDLAEYLLTNTVWNRDRIDSVVARPGQKIENETVIRLSKTFNIYILNLTVHPNGNKIQFFEDYYGQNNLLYKKLLQMGLLKN